MLVVYEHSIILSLLPHKLLFCRAIGHRYYLMYLDPGINGDAVLAAELQNVFHLAALRFLAYMRRLPDQARIQHSNRFFYGARTSTKYNKYCTSYVLPER